MAAREQLVRWPTLKVYQDALQECKTARAALMGLLRLPYGPLAGQGGLQRELAELDNVSFVPKRAKRE